MALTLGDNFSYQGAKPLDGRLKYDTLATMKAVADATMYDGCLAYCTATDKTYQWKASNTVDADTGKWREFTSGGGTEYDDFTGATSEEAGVHGLVPAPAIADREKFLKGDGTWGVVPMPSFDYSNTSPEAMNFSTDEKVIGTWTDGKPLYQKTVDLGTMPNNTSVSINHNIANIDKIIYYDGIMVKTNSYKMLPVVNDQAIDEQTVFNVTDTIIFIRCKKDLSTFNGYATIRYTKTTDSPVASGEKIVGQWIDGKPLYEKTFTDSCNIEVDGASNQTVLDVTSLNIDTCVDLLGFYTVTGNTRIPLNAASYWSNSGKYFMVETKYRTNNVIDVHNTYNTLMSYTITIRYTKAS